MKKLLFYLLLLWTSASFGQATTGGAVSAGAVKSDSTNVTNTFVAPQNIGTPAITTTGVALQMTGSTNSFFQAILQNTNSGSVASSDYIVNNDLGTATTFYGDFGINSSGFTGSGNFNKPSATYLYSQSGDLDIGTISANPIHFIVGSPTAADAMIISSTGNVGINSTPSADAVDAAVQFTASRTTAPATATVGLLQHNVFTVTPVDNTTVQTAMLGDIQLNGAGTTGTGHSIAGIFRATDTSSNAGGQFSGLEGKRVSMSNTNNGAAIFAVGDYNSASSMSGVVNQGLNFLMEHFNGSTTVPVAAGEMDLITAQTPIGGDTTKMYGIKLGANWQIDIGGAIISRKPSDLTQGFTIQQGQVSGSDALLTSSGNIYMNPLGGTFSTTGSFIPFTNNSALGSSSNRWALSASTGDYSGKITKYNNVSTVGNGVPSVYAAGRVTAQTGSAASFSTYTNAAADGSFIVSANILVTASTTNSFTCTCTYTDEGNTSRTLTMTFSNLTGTLLQTITNVTGTGAYEGVPLHIRAKASTAITFATVGTFTSVTYNAEAVIQQIN